MKTMLKSSYFGRRMAIIYSACVYILNVNTHVSFVVYPNCKKKTWLMSESSSSIGLVHNRDTVLSHDYMHVPV